jgi:cysteinyl-tRNA synthetase
MEAISGKKPMAKYWMHVGFLTVNGQKMSKSVGNFITIGDFLKRCPANYLRFFIAKNLWSSPVDYSESVMIEVKGAVSKIEEFLRKIKENRSKTLGKNYKIIKEFKKQFYSQLEDDFNTPKAFAIMFEFIKTANQLLDENILSKTETGEIYKFFIDVNNIFGIIDIKKINQKIPAEIKKLVRDRELARKNQNWQKSDELRGEIEKKGFVVEDTKDGSVVKFL